MCEVKSLRGGQWQGKVRTSGWCLSHKLLSSSFYPCPSIKRATLTQPSDCYRGLGPSSSFLSWKLTSPRPELNHTSSLEQPSWLANHIPTSSHFPQPFLCPQPHPETPIHIFLCLFVHFPKNNYPLILNTQQLLWMLAQSNLQSITPVCSSVWETVRVPRAQQAVPWPVFAACCKGLNGAPQGGRGWAKGPLVCHHQVSASITAP